MAQPFSMRYMLVDGQGNFGSVDGDAPAAMRYTEVRMARIAQTLLDDLDKETVDFTPNYDDSEHEPAVLPARFPNLLVNGSAGIAVGMATNIPPHNLMEITNACFAIIENPEVTVDELLAHVPGPDFPTAALINGVRGIREAYRTGRGRIYLRARTDTEIEKRSGREAIIVAPLFALLIALGVAPTVMLDPIDDATRQTLEQVGVTDPDPVFAQGGEE
jgi:DNA gyrase subunit A